ncbi:MAG: NAD-dependent deacylase [Kiritimatiellaeota bacterium]|nr:NAD-dependent deacylase [Kiritimatiellota bacterium]
MAAADIARVAEWVLAAERIAVLTGAGISTASGIPDFRSAAGIYATRASENVFDIELFRRDPLPFYRFAAWFYSTIANAQPNAAHIVLADWERGGKRVEIATQNVDDLHQRAGSQRVYGVHGSWLTSVCLQCSKVWRTAEAAFPSLGKNKVPDFQALENHIPHCDCGGLLKPEITFFGEALPQTAWFCAMEAMSHAELVLVLGTSLAVYPAAALPDYRDMNARLVIINREATPLDANADAVLRGNLPDLMQQINDRAFQA